MATKSASKRGFVVRTGWKPSGGRYHPPSLLRQYRRLLFGDRQYWCKVWYSFHLLEQTQSYDSVFETEASVFVISSFPTSVAGRRAEWTAGNTCWWRVLSSCQFVRAWWQPCRHGLSIQQHTHTLGYLWPSVYRWLHFGRHVHFQGKFLLLLLCEMDVISIYMPVCVCVCVAIQPAASYLNKTRMGCVDKMVVWDSAAVTDCAAKRSVMAANWLCS